MRMLVIMGSSLVLTLGLRLVEPPMASAVSAPTMVQSTDTFTVPPHKAARPLIAIVADQTGAQTAALFVPASRMV